MTEIEQVFSYGDHPVRVVDINGEPWFVALDVCAVLNIRNSRDAVGGLDEDERGVASTDTPGGQQEVLIVNEPGLYSLLFRSRKASAKKFKRWVTHEVLPQIRRTGSYTAAPAIRAESDELDLIIATAVEMKRMRDEVKEIASVAATATQEATVANARLDAIEGRHGYYAALGWAKLRKFAPSDERTLAALGRVASTVGKQSGILPGSAPHARFGSVNTWPLEVWDEAAVRFRGAA